MPTQSRNSILVVPRSCHVFHPRKPTGIGYRNPVPVPIPNKRGMCQNWLPEQPGTLSWNSETSGRMLAAATHTPIHRWGCLNKSQIFKQDWIISIMSRFIQFLLFLHECIHQLTHPPIHQLTGRDVSTNQKSSNRIGLSWLIQVFFILIIWYDPSHQPTHHPTHTPIHPPIREGVSANQKSTNRIDLSQLGQDCFNF